jgi:phage baseplate assembly protein W
MSTTTNTQSGFLGTGWSFPPTFDPAAGTVVLVSDVTDIEQSLNILLSTSLGERVMQPNYGCALQPYLFEPLNASLIGYLKDRVQNAILFYEPRITVVSIDVTAQDSPQLWAGQFQITVTYDIIQTNSRLNYVYSYYLNEALQPI